MKERIPFAKISISENEEQEIIACLRSGWITTGPRVAAFEKAFAEFVGCEDAVAVSSGTAALHLSLMTLNLSPGDEIITPSLTWVSVPNLITLMGAKPVFCDVDSQTLNIDCVDLERRITPQTRAIVPVHFAGRPCNLAKIRELAASHGLVVIEDACHAIGAKFDNIRIGSHSPLCAFSFHPNKNMTTAEGGMLTGNDRERLRKARLLRFHGVSRDTFQRIGLGSLPHYESIFPGLKYNMTDLAASIGMHQIKKVASFNAARSVLVCAYQEALSSLTEVLWLAPPNSGEDHTHAWHLFNVCVRDEEGLRERVMQSMLDNGVQIGLHYSPVHLMESMRIHGRMPHLPVTERIGRTIMSLPLFPDMTIVQVERVVHLLRKAL